MLPKPLPGSFYPLHTPFPRALLSLRVPAPTAGSRGHSPLYGRNAMGWGLMGWDVDPINGRRELISLAFPA